MTKNIIIAAIIFIAFTISGYAQQDTISTKDAVKHIGEKVFVRGVVAGIWMSKSSTTYIYLDEKYPNQRFVAVKFKQTEVDISKIKVGCVLIISGEIKMYNEKPEIILNTQEQIVDVICE